LFFAWAKPVPFNPYKLRDHKYGSMKVALAGPLSNLILAVIFGLVCRFLPLANKIDLISAFFAGKGGLLTGDYSAVTSLMSGSFGASLFILSFVMCLINLSLMTFNLIPLPPLDGSKIIFPFLPNFLKKIYVQMEMSVFGLLIVFMLLMSGIFDPIFTLIPILLSLIIGL
jgi:Zn-dependent protease